MEKKKASYHSWYEALYVRLLVLNDVYLVRSKLSFFSRCLIASEPHITEIIIFIKKYFARFCWDFLVFRKDREELILFFPIVDFSKINFLISVKI